MDVAVPFDCELDVIVLQTVNQGIQFTPRFVFLLLVVGRCGELNFFDGSCFNGNLTKLRQLAN